MDDLDDPLRLRYEYCLAMVTRKRCETGLADGSMSYADAVQTLASILEETDYNPLLLQDMVNYGQQAGMNVENYRYAYEMILDIIQRKKESPSEEMWIWIISGISMIWMVTAATELEIMVPPAMSEAGSVIIYRGFYNEKNN